MDLLAVLRISVRRWYILLPLLVLSLAGAWSVAQQVKPAYKLDGILTSSAPYVASESQANLLSGNVFLDYNNTANIMAATADSPEVRTKLKATGADPNYTVQSEGSVVKVGVSEASPEQALATYRTLLDTLNARLDVLQAQAAIPPAFRVKVADALQPQGAQESMGNRQRVLLASAALGGILSIAICVFADYLLIRRRAVS